MEKEAAGQEEWNAEITMIEGEIKEIIKSCEKILSNLEQLRLGEKKVEKGQEIVNSVIGNSNQKEKSLEEILEELEMAMRW